MCGTYETMRSANARPRPAGRALLPFNSSLGTPGPGGWARALDTASLNLRLRDSIYEPSCTRGVAAAARFVAEGGRVSGEPVRLKEENDRTEEAREGRSAAGTFSGRAGVGDGEEGRLEGRRKAGVFNVYIVSSECRALYAAYM